MRTIQSFWSKPAFHNLQSYNNARKFGGWLNFKYFLISSSLSCLTIRKNQKQIELYTDTRGSEILIDQLKLPYQHVSLILDELDSEDHRLWIKGKMLTIQHQQSAFVHVDNDIYLWETLPTKALGPRELIAQSRAEIWLEYKLSLNELFANFKYIPECMLERPNKNTTVANVGIIGGNDMDFFHEFCELSNSLHQRNREQLSLVDLGGFNQMMEEYLFSSMIRFKKQPIKYLLEDFASDFPASHLHLNLVPIFCKYIHLIGRYKQQLHLCEQLSERLRYEYPSVFNNLTTLIHDIFKLEDASERYESKTQLVRLRKVLRVLYCNDLNTILKLKIRLIPGIEIKSALGYYDEEPKYFVIEEANGKLTYRHLPEFCQEDLNLISQFFVRNCTIVEALEHIKAQQNLNDLQYNGMRFRLLDAVTKNMLFSHLLEFCQEK